MWGLTQQERSRNPDVAMGPANSNSGTPSDDRSAWSRWLGWRKRPTPMPGRAKRESRPGLESVLGRPDFQIPGHRFVAAPGDILYAWMRAGAPL